MDRRRLLYPLVVTCVAAIVLLTNLGAPRLWDRDEPRNARCAVEMRERGDWIVPTFNGELRAHKPVLLYWLMCASYEVFGETEFAARLPSAMLGMATALATLAMGWRLFSPRAGLLAGIVLATTLSFDIAARAATPDAALLCCVTAAMAAFVWLVLPRVDSGEELTKEDTEEGQRARTPSSTRFGWAIVYAMLGLAVLAKGPVGLLLCVAILGLFQLIQRSLDQGQLAGRRRSSALATTFHPRHIAVSAWQMRPITLVIVVLAIAAPWYVAVHLRTGGAFTDEFFFRHNFERATSAMEGHKGPVVFYLGAALAGFFPWSVFAVPAMLETFRLLRTRTREAFGVTFAVCWAAVWIGAFSLVSTKLPSYITPAYPALALLTALYVDRWLAGCAAPAARWTPWVFVALATVGIGLAVGLPLVARKYLPGDEVLGLVGLVPIVTAAIAWFCWRRQRVSAAVTSMAIGATAFVVAMFGFGQVRVDQWQVSEDLANVVAHDAGSNTKFVAFRELEPSMVYYARRNIETLSEPTAAAELFENNDQAYLLASADDLPALRAQLPPDVEVVARRPKFLESGEVVLLARAPQALARRRESAGAAELANHAAREHERMRK
jgi:4-amino-4-deoxy-L-arabinose transferase-like glycosyltransferase